MAGIRLVNRQRGVKVNDMLYWCPEFRDAHVAGQRLPVRYDPWDASSVYIRLKDRWTRAVCRNLTGLGQLTDMERRALTMEYTQQHGVPGNDERSAQRLREFMQVFTPEGAMQAAFERQQENKSLHNSLQLGAITPVEQFKKISLIEETSEAANLADTRSSFDKFSQIPSETPASDSLPDFDIF